MKVAELKTFVVGNPPPAFGGRYFIFLKLVTACGVEGVGEVYAASFAPEAVVPMIRDVFERHVLGSDPFRIEALWRNVYGRGYTGRPDASLMGVLSGVEMALWDIVGKAVGKPVYELLGGKVHERLRSYTYLYPDEPGSHAYSDSPVYSTPHAAAERALKVSEAGLHRGEVRSRRSLLRPSIPGSRALSGSNLARPSARPCERRSGRGQTSCLGPTGNSPSRARCDWRAGSRPTSRCGLRSRPRPRRPRRWRRSRPSAACRSRPESG